VPLKDKNLVNRKNLVNQFQLVFIIIMQLHIATTHREAAVKHFDVRNYVGTAA